MMAAKPFRKEKEIMPEIVPEDFSTTLLSMYIATALERGLNTEHPRIYFAPKREESRPLRDIFPLDRGAEVWMCRDLKWTLGSLGAAVKPDQYRTYGGLKPDVWIQDQAHAIIIENKDGGHRSKRESEYLGFISEGFLGERKRAFLYSVPERWLPCWEEAEWWKFVRENPNDKVVRGIIAWDEEFIRVLCETLSVPRWFRDKLPNRVDEGRYLKSGQHFYT
jgi:hypothetical protein